MLLFKGNKGYREYNSHTFIVLICLSKIVPMGGQTFVCVFFVFAGFFHI